MTHGQIKSAYNAMYAIYNTQLPVRKAFQVYKLIRQLEVPKAFYAERSTALLEKHNGRMDDGNFVFSDKEDLFAYRQDLQELNDTEVELEIEPVTLGFSDIDDCKLSPAEIASLDGFIRFEE